MAFWGTYDSRWLIIVRTLLETQVIISLRCLNTDKHLSSSERWHNAYVAGVQWLKGSH